tara:strand:+ start:1141 stop:1914 length:774 start_codon:yes stop_codon:yes gene_type:complete
MPYENDDHCTSSLVWPERVDHYEKDRAGIFKGTTRKQDLLIMYRRVHGGQYFDDQQVIQKARYLKEKAQFNPNVKHTALNHAFPNLIDGQASVLLNIPKLVITPCKEGFQEMRQYAGFMGKQTLSIIESIDYHSITADYYLDYRNLFTHDYNVFYNEYMNLVKCFNLTPNTDAVRGFILRLMDRMKHCDEYLWKIMRDDGTLSEPYYSAPYQYEDLYSPVFREFEAAYLHFIKLKNLPYQMNAVRTRILLDLDKKNR